MAPVKAGYWFNGCGVSVENLDSTLFTHLYFGFAGVDPTTKRVKIFKADQDDFSTFAEKVRAKNASVKTLLSIGGVDAPAKFLAEIFEHKNTRASFIESSINTARSYNFDGLDLNWEYPSTKDEMEYFGALLNEWRHAIRTEANSSDKEELLLTAATFYVPTFQGREYNPNVLKNLDWINIIAYDFHVPALSRNLTVAHAALEDPKGFSVAGSVTAWKQKMPDGKFVLGLPFHGYAWLLRNSNANGMSAQANGPAKGVGIREAGRINYNYVLDFISSNRIQMNVDYVSKTEYCTAGTTWISYNDNESITRKVQYARGKDLHGYFVNNVGADSEWTLSQAASNAW